MADRRGTSPARVAASLPALVLALAAAACSPAASPGSSVTPTEVASPAATAMPTETTTASIAEPSAPASATTGAAPCTAADLKVSHGIVEGAAGSRLTSVVLVAAVPCSVDAFPAFGIRDAGGAEVVGSAAGGTGQVELSPDDSYESDLRFANWCGANPAFPLQLELRIGAEVIMVTGSSFPEQGDMPPCNGTNGPELDATGWQLSP